jgi:hypothetical protein
VSKTYTGKKTASLTSGVGKTGYLPVVFVEDKN